MSSSMSLYLPAKVWPCMKQLTGWYCWCCLPSYQQATHHIGLHRPGWTQGYCERILRRQPSAAASHRPPWVGSAPACAQPGTSAPLDHSSVDPHCEHASSAHIPVFNHISIHELKQLDNYILGKPFRNTGCRLPYGITQFYLPPNTSKHIPP